MIDFLVSFPFDINELLYTSTRDTINTKKIELVLLLLLSSLCTNIYSFFSSSPLTVKRMKLKYGILLTSVTTIGY
jgi:hypothetical protein